VNEDLEAQVRRLWGGEVASSRPEPDDLPSELVRTVSAASTIAKDQVDRLNKLSLPLLRLNAFEERSSPIAAAGRFLDQIRSDYRRVSPRIDLSTLEQFRHTDGGQETLHEAHVDNQSVGVLAVGELLDSLQPVEILRQWTDFGQTAAAEVTDYTSIFGNVLGPIVEFALTFRSPSPAWAADLESAAGHKWVETFIRAGADGLRDARPHGVFDGAPA
jgi:hypothetical protein